MTSTYTAYSLRFNADATGVSKVEWSTSTRAPSSGLAAVAARTVNLSSAKAIGVPETALVVLGTTTAKWLRLTDRAGNVSAWFAG